MADTFTMNRRIGSTNYTVNVNFIGDSSVESFEDKIIKIIRRETVDESEKSDIIDIPQMSRQSERSA